MTAGDDTMMPESERDHLAAEFVLGVLDTDQRIRCQKLVSNDPGFAQRVAAWEYRFSPLNTAYTEVAPPAGVFGAVEDRLFGKSDRSGIWNSVRIWRLGAIAALLALAVLAAVNVGLFGPGTTGPGSQLIATLQAEGSDARFAALYDVDKGTIRINAITGAPDENRDFELWFIAGDRPPVSLGLLNRETGTRVIVEAGQRALFVDGTVLAISHEPLGGSPTGAPSGPVVAVGAIHQI